MIVISLILMLKIIPLALTKPGHTRSNKNGLSGNDIGSRGIKNLSTVEKLAKCKKLDFTKFKPFEADFLILKPKKSS